MGKALINIPTLAMIYNQYMVGTDQFDQLLLYYKTTVKTANENFYALTKLCSRERQHTLSTLSQPL